MLFGVLAIFHFLFSEKYIVDLIHFLTHPGPQFFLRPNVRWTMQQDQIRGIISGIKRFELTPAETEFIAFAERNINQHGPIMRKIEPVLEGIYWQKTEFIRNSIRSMLKKERKRFHLASIKGKAHIFCGQF